MSIKFSFDSLSVRDQRLFGWGWLLAEHSPVKRIELRLISGDGQKVHLRCTIGGSRSDLADAFPDIPYAIGGGFLVQGRLPFPMEDVSGELWAEFLDDSEASVTLPDFPRRYIQETLSGQLQGKTALLTQLIRRGEFVLLVRRAILMLVRRLDGLLRRINSHRMLMSTSEKVTIMFDHAMGGGANQFRNQRVAQWLGDGRHVLLVTPHLPTLSYEVARFGNDSERVARYDNLSDCLAALPEPSEIVVNNLVSFDDPLQVLAWIARTRSIDIKTTFFLHDYHAACPVWTLVDPSGRYCDVPDLARCASCLSKNDAAFLALMPLLDIENWRAHWERFLLTSDHIVAFSRASVRVLHKAFPDFPIERVVIEPHRTDYISPQSVPYCLELPLIVGVVGSINVYKGARIVAEMAQLILRDQLPVKIVVIGTIDGVTPSAALCVTGPYQSDHLPQILEHHRVGICLLPSICHETFSYVTAELMAHRMPLAVFDLGAPADRVRDYELGRIIPLVDAAVALDCLFQFRLDLLSDEAGSPAGFSASRCS